MPLWEEAVTEYGAEDGARRRHFTWLHDGTRIAYVDDSAGFERIAVEPADRSAAPDHFSSANVGRITELIASPVDDTFAFANHRHQLMVIAPGKEPRLLDTSSGWRITDLAFSPDGRFIAYAWSPAHDTSIIRIVDLTDDQRVRCDVAAARPTALRLGIRRGNICISFRPATFTRSMTRCNST